MDGFERVVAVEQVREGEIGEYHVAGVSICLARSDGVMYAFAASCTHQECPLSTAYIDGPELECECHGATFDLTTGAVTLPPAYDALPVYPVREVDGVVWVAVNAPVPH